MVQEAGLEPAYLQDWTYCRKSLSESNGVSSAEVVYQFPTLAWNGGVEGIPTPDGFKGRTCFPNKFHRASWTHS